MGYTINIALYSQAKEMKCVLAIVVECVWDVWKKKETILSVLLHICHRPSSMHMHQRWTIGYTSVAIHPIMQWEVHVN